MEEKKKQMKTDIKADLDKLVQKYETKEFIENDPIQFPHRFEDERDIELAGFISSLFAYGNRKVFIKKLDELFQIMQNEPLNFVQNFDEKLLKGFSYRFSKDFEIIETFKILKKLYKTSNLKELFEKNPPKVEMILAHMSSRLRKLTNEYLKACDLFFDIYHSDAWDQAMKSRTEKYRESFYD